MSKRGNKSGIALLSPEGARSATGGERLDIELSLYLYLKGRRLPLRHDSIPNDQIVPHFTGL